MVLADDVKTAEQNYIGSVTKTAEEQKRQAEEMTDTSTLDSQAVADTLQGDTLQNDLARAKSTNPNRLVADMVQSQKTDRVEMVNERILAEKQKRDEKNKLLLATYNMASEQAKQKYRLAAQRLQQSKQNWANAAALCQSLGLVVPGAQYIGAGIGILGGML